MRKTLLMAVLAILFVLPVSLGVSAKADKTAPSKIARVHFLCEGDPGTCHCPTC